MPNTNLKTPKYRVSLTAEQISYIIVKAKLDIADSSKESDIAYQLIPYLAPFITKIENNGIKPAFIPKPKESLMSKLGALEELAPPRVTKEETWAQSYARYKLDPTSCNMVQIQEAHEHMYLNELMDKEQVRAFELKDAIAEVKAFSEYNDGKTPNDKEDI